MMCELLMYHSMAILSRLCRHEIKYMKTIAMIFIIFGSQRHLKSGLSGSFMVVGRLLLDSKVGWIGDSDGVLYVLYYIINDQYGRI